MQKLKTRVMKKNVNPEWNEDLTLSISDPNLPITLVSDSFIAARWCEIHLVNKRIYFSEISAIVYMKKSSISSNWSKEPTKALKHSSC